LNPSSTLRCWVRAFNRHCPVLYRASRRTRQVRAWKAHISDATPTERARSGISLKFQITSVLPALTVYDNVHQLARRRPSQLEPGRRDSRASLQRFPASVDPTGTACGRLDDGRAKGCGRAAGAKTNHLNFQNEEARDLSTSPRNYESDTVRGTSVSIGPQKWIESTCPYKGATPRREWRRTAGRVPTGVDELVYAARFD